MNGKPVYNVIRLLKSAVCLLFIGLFTARTQAQILGGPPDITVQPVGLSVQNGGTAILTTSVLLSLTQLQIYLAIERQTRPDHKHHRCQHLRRQPPGHHHWYRKHFDSERYLCRKRGKLFSADKKRSGHNYQR